MTNNPYRYALLVNWDYGKRKKYAVESNSQAKTFQEAQKKLEKLLKTKADKPWYFNPGFGAQIIEIKVVEDE